MFARGVLQKRAARHATFLIRRSARGTPYCPMRRWRGSRTQRDITSAKVVVGLFLVLVAALAALVHDPHVLHVAQPGLHKRLSQSQ